MFQEKQYLMKTPFIPSELRPTVGAETEKDSPCLGPHATKAEIAKAAQSILTEEEQIMVERGREWDTTQLNQTVMTLSPDVHSTALDGEAVLLNLQNGQYYTMNRVGTVVWEMLREHKPLAEVHHAICSRFEVTETQARNDLVALVNHLGQEGLIQEERR